MKLPSDRWPESHQWTAAPPSLGDELDDIIVRLPCYEPAGAEISLSARDLLRHVLITGQTGSGKTSLLNRICADLIGYRSSISGRAAGLLILDCQEGQSLEHVRSLAKEAGRADDVIVLSPTEGFYDPMAELRDFASLDVTTSKVICASSFYSSDNENIYWHEHARVLIEAILALLLVTEERVSLSKVIERLSAFYLGGKWSAQTKEQFQRYQTILHRAAPMLSNGMASKLRRAAETLEGWWSLDSRTRSILSSVISITVAPFLAASALPYWNGAKGGRMDPTLALEGKIVFVALPGATEPETAGLLCRLIKMEFYRAAQRRRSIGNHPLAGLITDEYHLAVTQGSPRWSDATHLATLRSKGVFTIAATQGLIQLDQLIGRGATESLLINFSNLLLLRSQEVGHLYQFAERIFGNQPGRLLSKSRIEEYGDTLVAIPSIVAGAQPVCPPGALAALEPFQAYVSLANGFRSTEPVWLAPLFLESSSQPGATAPDFDLMRIREARITPPPPPPKKRLCHYSPQVWAVLINILPRQVAARRMMTLGEFRRGLKGLGQEPTGIEKVPAAWRMGCFKLAQKLPATVKLLHLGVEDGELSLMFAGGGGTSALSLPRLCSRWQESVYPTTLRPVHRRDRRWLEVHFPHLLEQLAGAPGKGDK